MDTARHVPGPFFRDRWIPAIHRVRPDLFLLAEAFLERSAVQLKPFVVDQGFDSALNFPLRRALVDALAKGSSVDLIAQSVQETVSILGLDRTLLLVNFLDNHDVPRFVNEPGLAVAEQDIQNRYRLALTALFTLPGIPQLYYGSELGLYGGGDPDNRRDMPDWAWEPSGRSQPRPGQALLTPQLTFSDVQKLIRIRHEHSALYRGDYAEMWRHHGDPQPNVYAFFRSDGGSRIITALNRIITALNNGDVPSGSLSMPIMGNGGIAA
jgi:alpha-amylase